MHALVFLFFAPLREPSTLARLSSAKTILLILLLFPYASYAQKRETNNLFLVRQNGKWGDVDRKGQMVIPAQFDSALGFNDGLARIWFGGEQGYIDSTGNFVWKPSK